MNHVHIIDWALLILYFLGVVGLGFLFSRKQEGVNSFFLARRNMPTWAVTLSIVATSLSAGTYLGNVQYTYNGRIIFISMALGNVVAALVASFVLIPAYYKSGCTTAYGYLGKRFGVRSMYAASISFLFGRLLAAGARVFIAAIAVSVLIYGDLRLPHLVVAILLLGTVATIYTVAGGIKAVIWTDVLQIFVMSLAGVLCIIFLLDKIPLSTGEIINVLKDADGVNKLQLLEFKFDLSDPYTIWSLFFAIAIFDIAQLGVDQDLIQRVLTCKSRARASMAMIASRLVHWPVTLIFAVIGLLLYIYYGRPDIMGDAASSVVLADTRQVFVDFMIHDLPVGVRGLALIGLFAAAMSSFDSSANSMASSFVADLYLPLKHKQTTASAKHELKISRLAVIGMGAVLTLFAIVAAIMQTASGLSLIDFALGVMTFAYAGLLGVFLTGTLTKRGNETTVVAALVAGVISILLLQPFILGRLSTALFGFEMELAWPWWMVVGGTISFIICALGAPDRKSLT